MSINVGDRAQLVYRAQRAPPLDARLDRRQEEHRDRHVHDVPDRCSRCPAPSSGSVDGGPIWTWSDRRLTSKAHEHQDAEEADRHAQRGISGRLIQIAVSAVWCAMPRSSLHDARQAGAGEALLHALDQTP